MIPNEGNCCGASLVHIHNRRWNSTVPYRDELRAIISLEEGEAARREISSWPDYRPTPLVRLKKLAEVIGVNEIYYKDEGNRFGLKSFRALGGAHAISCLLRRHIRQRVNIAGRAAATAILSSAPSVELETKKAAKLLTKDEARRIAANIAKLPELLGRK